MLKSLFSKIADFTNAKNYSFDFSKSDLLELEDNLIEDSVSLSIFDSVNDIEILILFISDKKTDKTKTFKLPKKVTKKWILSKVDSFLNSEYKNLTTLFKNIGLDGVFYSAGYGIGYSAIHKNSTQFIRDTEAIESKLNDLGIEFKTKFSAARWVLRYIISTKKENLQKVSKL